jgi:hypothetical protein
MDLASLVKKSWCILNIIMRIGTQCFLYNFPVSQITNFTCWFSIQIFCSSPGSFCTETNVKLIWVLKLRGNAIKLSVISAPNKAFWKKWGNSRESFSFIVCYSIHKAILHDSFGRPIVIDSYKQWDYHSSLDQNVSRETIKPWKIQALVRNLIDRKESSISKQS